MAIQYLCDRCGRVSVSASEMQSIRVPKYSVHINEEHVEVKIYELCKVCILGIHKYMDEIPK